MAYELERECLKAQALQHRSALQILLPKLMLCFLWPEYIPEGIHSSEFSSVFDTNLICLGEQVLYSKSACCYRQIACRGSFLSEAAKSCVHLPSTKPVSAFNLKDTLLWTLLLARRAAVCVQIFSETVLAVI